MTFKDKYIKLYMHFVHAYNLKPSHDAIRDITNGDRLVFGIGHTYHIAHSAEWVRLVSPIYGEHVGEIIKANNKVQTMSWDNDLFMKYWEKSLVGDYFNKLVTTPFCIDEFFKLYKQINNAL